MCGNVWQKYSSPVGALARATNQYAAVGSVAVGSLDSVGAEITEVIELVWSAHRLTDSRDQRIAQARMSQQQLSISKPVGKKFCRCSNPQRPFYLSRFLKTQSKLL